MFRNQFVDTAAGSTFLYFPKFSKKYIKMGTFFFQKERNKY
jgi:hypothetical protein